MITDEIFKKEIWRIMYFIRIYNSETNKSWQEEFDSYYLFSKRVTKLKYSKKLVITSRSNLNTF